MGIINISRDWGTEPALVRIESTDDLTTILTPGYLSLQKSNIESLNHGIFDWVESDAILMTFNGNTQKGLFTRNSATNSLVLETLVMSLDEDKVFVGDSNNIATQDFVSGENMQRIDTPTTVGRGTPVFTYHIEVPGGATNTQNLQVSTKVRIYRVYLISQGEGVNNDNIVVLNNANLGAPVTEILNTLGATTNSVTLQFEELISANAEINAGDTITVTQTAAVGDIAPAFSIYVDCVCVN